jgi:hypothetical protein
MRIRQLLAILMLPIPAALFYIFLGAGAWRVITHRILHDPDGNKIVIVQQPPRS